MGAGHASLGKSELSECQKRCFFCILVGCLHYYKCRHFRQFFGGSPFNPNIFSFAAAPPPPLISHQPHYLVKKWTIPYLCVSAFSTKVLLENTMRLLLDSGAPFYVVHVLQATRRSSRSQDKASIFISQLFYQEPGKLVRFRDRTRDLPLWSWMKYIESYVR